MIYTDERLKIRIVPFTRERHMNEKYRSWFHDPIATQFNSHGLFPYTAAAMEEFVAVIEKGSSSKIVWAIEVKMTEEERKQGKGNFMPLPPETYAKIAYGWKHVGNCSLQGINYINRSCEIAIVIGEADARGRGVGKQVCQWMLDHAFLKLGMNRAWTGTAATNVAMRKTCIAIGMQQEGIFKDGMFLDGEYVDVIAFGITRKMYNLTKETDIGPQ